MSKISRREFVETTGAGLVVATSVPRSQLKKWLLPFRRTTHLHQVDSERNRTSC